VLLSPDHIAAVRALFDLPRNPLPIALVSAVLRDQHLKTKTQRRIARLLFAQALDRTIEILPRNRGFDLLDPLEVLLVQRLEARELHFRVVQ
jgi:hypothetical protein